MKVRCIDDNKKLRNTPITEGKVYSVLGTINGCYMILNDNGEEGCYLKSRFEEVEEMEKEKVLEVEFQEVFDKVAWRIVYYNKEAIIKNKFEDGGLGFTSVKTPTAYPSKFVLYNSGEIDDSGIGIMSKEASEKFKDIVREVNEEYGIPKRWRANIGERYFYITDQGRITYDFEHNTREDDLRHQYGNYFRTEDDGKVKLEKIRLLFKGE